MTETCAAYVAGLLDADGWISVHPNNIGTTWQGYTFQIGIVNKHLETLQWVQSNFGGNVVPRKRNQMKRDSAKWSQVYDWKATSECAESFLRTVIPYMRVKKRQAELMLEFLDTIADRKTRPLVPVAVKARRVEIFQEVKDLNRLGQVAVLKQEVS